LINPQHNPAGVNEHERVKWFVDFLSGVVKQSTRADLENAIIWKMHQEGLTPNKIAVPKLGNVLLARGVADRLKLPLVLLRPTAAEQWRAGVPFDGDLHETDRVLLVDDVASKARFLIRCVTALRDRHLEASNIVVVAERSEYRCAAELEREGVKLHAVIQLDDAAITEIRRRAKIGK
jgi:orotate phosphoribosyltransferase